MGVKELIHFLLFIFRRNKHDSERKSSQGKKTWLPFSRLLNRLLFLIRKSLTVVFALFPWSLEKEWYSENVYIDSAGQRSQLHIGCHETSNRETSDFSWYLYLRAVSISDRTPSNFVITVLSGSVSFSLARKRCPSPGSYLTFFLTFEENDGLSCPWKIREIEGWKYAGIKIERPTYGDVICP